MYAIGRMLVCTYACMCGDLVIYTAPFRTEWQEIQAQVEGVKSSCGQVFGGCFECKGGLVGKLNAAKLNRSSR